MKKLLCIIVAVLLLAAVLPVVLLPGIPDDAPPLQVVGHRGYSAKAPENTLASFRLAGEHGFWGCEFDIYPSADGRWVIMHDPKVDRMTNGSGKITEKTYAELQKLRITAGKGLDRYPDERIPTLEEALEICEQTGMLAFVEVKAGSAEQIAQLAKILGSRSAAPVVISFEAEILAALKRALPQIQMYYLVEHIHDADIQYCRENGIDGIDFRYDRNSDQNLGSILSNGLPAAAWTVNDVYEARMLQRKGVSVITSNEALHEMRPGFSALSFQKYLHVITRVRAWASSVKNSLK